MHKLLFIKGFVFSAMVLALPVQAETTTYNYDAKGRLVRVVKSGGPNNGTVTVYQHDQADNRKTVKTTGSSR